MKSIDTIVEKCYQIVQQLTSPDQKQSSFRPLLCQIIEAAKPLLPLISNEIIVSHSEAREHDAPAQEIAYGKRGILLDGWNNWPNKTGDKNVYLLENGELVETKCTRYENVEQPFSFETDLWWRLKVTSIHTDAIKSELAKTCALSLWRNMARYLGTVPKKELDDKIQSIVQNLQTTHEWVMERICTLESSKESLTDRIKAIDQLIADGSDEAIQAVLDFYDRPYVGDDPARDSHPDVVRYAKGSLVNKVDRHRTSVWCIGELRRLKTLSDGRYYELFDVDIVEHIRRIDELIMVSKLLYAVAPGKANSQLKEWIPRAIRGSYDLLIIETWIEKWTDLLSVFNDHQWARNILLAIWKNRKQYVKNKEQNGLLKRHIQNSLGRELSVWERIL